MTARSDFVDLIRPLQDRLDIYDRTRSPLDQPNNDAADPVRACPQGFIDAMTVREEIYVKEQNVPLENELDEDDARAFHWVAYASIPAPSNGGATTSTDLSSPSPSSSGPNPRSNSTSTKIPIGTIRLVPPPHPNDHSLHPAPGPSPQSEGTPETYCKLGRLAVIKEFRKAGISKLLVETALAHARVHPQDMDGPQPDPTSIEAARRGTAASQAFRGLVLVHSQLGVQKVWARFGFERDESMGEWDEEGIGHCGMWRRVDVSAGRARGKGVKGWLGGVGGGGKP